MESVTFADIRRNVKESMSSIFTREDVLNIIDKLEKSNHNIGGKDLLDLKTILSDVIEAASNIENIDTSDIADVQLSLNGMEVCVDSVEIAGLDDAIHELRLACNDLTEFCKNIVK